MEGPTSPHEERAGVARARPGTRASASPDDDAELREVTLYPLGTPPRDAAGDARGAAAAEGSQELLDRLRGIAAHSPRSNRYTVIGEIGAGGMGRVLRVWDNDLSRELARKEIATRTREASSDKSRVDQSRRLERFLEEARVTSQLDHPGIVPIHEIAIDEDGVVYFTMPFVRGRDLRRVFELVHERREDWSLHRALGVILKVCEAVSYAHARGVVHRDLKPANIMLGPFGETYVMDWGLALVPGREEGGVAGTPAYMAPEQAGLLDDPVGPRVDVYAIGAILYELLTRRMPHAPTTESDASADLEALFQPPAPIGEVAPETPRELAAICAMAMAWQPADRYPSVAALRADLRAYVEGRVVQAYESGELAMLRKWVRRNPLLTGTLAALPLVVALAGATVAWVQSMRLHDVRHEQQIASLERYAADLRAIDLGLQVNDMSYVSARLAGVPPELRGPEWALLAVRADASLAHLELGTPAGAVALSPDGARFATGDQRGRLRLWRTADMAAVEVPIEGHDQEVRGLAFVADGTQLVSVSEDGTLCLWSLADGARLWSLETGSTQCALDTATDAGGRELVATAGFDGAVTVRALPSGEELARHVTGRRGQALTDLAFTPDGARVLAVGSDGAVFLWDVKTDRTIGERRITTGLRTVAVSPDGQRAALGDLDGVITLVTLPSLDVLATVSGHDSSISALAFAPAFDVLISGALDATVRAWTLDGEAAAAPLHGHKGDVLSIAVHDRRVLSASGDGTVRSWRPDRGAVLDLRGHEGSATCLAVPRAGTPLASGSRDGTVRLWDPESGRELAHLPAPGLVSCLAFHPNGELVAVGGPDPAIRLVEARTGSTVRELHGHESFPAALAFMADGARLVSRGDGGTVRVWDPRSGEQLLLLTGLDVYSRTLAVDPTGARFATGESDGRVLLWDDHGATPLTTLDAGAEVVALAFHPRGELLAVGTMDRRILLFERLDRAGRRWSEPLALLGHDHRLSALAFSPDGTRLLSGSPDRTVRLWDPRAGRLLLTLRELEDAVTDVAYAPTGAWIAAATEAGTLRVWRLRGSADR